MCLLVLWCLAFSIAPLLVLVATLAGVLPVRLLRGHTALTPSRLQARHLWLDNTRSGTVTVRQASGRDSVWEVRNWLRHPWLVVLYLEADGTHATVLLAADSMERRGYRQLRYLLGVRTVGPDSAAVSG